MLIVATIIELEIFTNIESYIFAKQNDKNNAYEVGFYYEQKVKISLWYNHAK